MRCHDCDREECPLLHLGKGMSPEDATQAFARTNQIQRARFNCQAHAVNWHERALAAEARERWIPVTERLPEEYEDVIVTVHDRDGKAYVETAYMIRDLDGVVWWRRDERAIPDATHWRPLPAPPEQ